MEELRAEEERHIRQELSEAELELFDLLRKEQLTADEEKHMKLSAKGLYNTLTENAMSCSLWDGKMIRSERSE